MRQNEKWMHVSHFRLRRKFEKKRDNEMKVLIEIGCRITCPTGNMIPGTGCLFHANRYFLQRSPFFQHCVAQISQWHRLVAAIASVCSS